MMLKSAITAVERQKLLPYGLEPEQIEGLTALVYERGEWICREGDCLSYLFFILSGKAKVICTLENGRSLLLAFYYGGIIGDLELMTHTATAHNSIQAATDLRCIGIPVPANRRLLLTSNSFLNCVGSSLAYKLMRSSRNSAHHILYPLQVRLCSYLSVAHKEGRLGESLTEVADLLGSSYRHLLRELSNLAQEGVLRKEGHTWVISDLTELKRRSCDYNAPVEQDLH